METVKEEGEGTGNVCEGKKQSFKEEEADKQQISTANRGHC